MLVSVVIPCYYSEGMIEKVVTLTRDEFVAAGYDYEFVLVNDGSTDGTFAAITRLVQADRNVVGIDCAKNLGQHNAIMAGLQKTRGDLIMVMDDDMQTHPSQCPKLLQAIQDGSYDVVLGKWSEQKEAWWRRAGSAFAEWSMRVMTKSPKDLFMGNFIVMRRHVRDEVVRYTGPYVYVQGLTWRATSNMANVEIEHFDREMGESGYTLKRLVQLWSVILNFSMMPLRTASVLGSVMGLVGLLAAIVIVISKFADPTMQAGWPSMMAAIAIVGGLILLGLGVVGEYLGRMFMVVNKAPQYVVRQTLDEREERGDSLA